MPRTLGDGQVAASATAIYTAVSANSPSGERVSLSFCNTAATSETLVVTFKNNGGTSRRLLRQVLAENEQIVINGITMQNGDVILATTTNASAVDYVVQSDAAGAFMITSFTAAGAIKSALAANFNIDGDITVDSITGGDDSLGITGAASGAGVTGGAVVVAGGVPASGNAVGGLVSNTGWAGSGTQAGGTSTVVGGAGGATGAGGAVSVTGGAGGATSGTGGAASITGGAGTGVGAAGGAVSATAGASAVGTGTTAGGAGANASLVATAGGAKTDTGNAVGGAGGAAAVTAGAGGATASSGANNGGAGGAVTITAGVGGNATAGTGGGGNGGNITLVCGTGGTSAGGAAGDPGKLKLSTGIQHWTNAQTIDMADAAVTLTLNPGTPTGTTITSNVLYVDANSSGTENLLLPPEADCNGLILMIVNTGGEDIIIKEDSASTTIATLSTTETAMVTCNGTLWAGGVLKVT